MIKKLKVKSEKLKVSAESGFVSSGKSLKFLVLSFSFAFFVLRFSLCAATAQPPEEFVYDSLGKRDPMIPLVTPQGLIRDIKSFEAEGGFSLEGVIYDEKTGKSFAVINGEILKVGETVSGAEVLEIKKDKVIIFSDGAAREIGLEKEEEQ